MIITAEQKKVPSTLKPPRQIDRYSTFFLRAYRQKRQVMPLTFTCLQDRIVVFGLCSPKKESCFETPSRRYWNNRLCYLQSNEVHDDNRIRKYFAAFWISFWGSETQIFLCFITLSIAPSHASPKSWNPESPCKYRSFRDCHLFPPWLKSLTLAVSSQEVLFPQCVPFWTHQSSDLKG